MIFVECNADVALVRSLGIPQSAIRHAGDKGAVCSQLERATDAVGIVDEDPWDPLPPPLLRLQGSTPEDPYGLKVFQIRDNRLIVLCPRLEEWVLKAAEEAGVQPEGFGLPDDGKALRRAAISREKNFEKFLSALSRSQRFQRLRKLLTEEGCLS